jgi:hypothetical protein
MKKLDKSPRGHSAQANIVTIKDSSSEILDADLVHVYLHCVGMANVVDVSELYPTFSFGAEVS